jgi:hypothetical protein
MEEKRSYSVDPELMHYARGQRAQNHKYIAIKNGKYIYPDSKTAMNQVMSETSDVLSKRQKQRAYLEGGRQRRLNNGSWIDSEIRKRRNNPYVKKYGKGQPLYKEKTNDGSPYTGTDPIYGKTTIVRRTPRSMVGETTGHFVDPNSRRDTNFGGDTHHSDLVRPRMKKYETKLNSRMDKAQSRYNSMVDRMATNGSLTNEQASEAKRTFDETRKKVVDENIKKTSNKLHGAAVRGAIIGRKISEAPDKAYKSVSKTAKDAYRIGSNLKTRAAKEVKNATTSASKSATKTYNNLRKDVSRTAKNASKAVSGAYKDTTSSLEKSYKSTKKKANKAKKNATKTLRGYASKGKSTINRIIN